MWNYVNHKLINFSFQFSSKLVAIGAKLFFTNKSFNVFQSIFLSLSREKPMKINLIYHFVQQIFSLSINSTILLIFWSFTSYLILKYATFVADKKLNSIFYFCLAKLKSYLWLFLLLNNLRYIYEFSYIDFVGLFCIKMPKCCF